MDGHAAHRLLYVKVKRRTVEERGCLFEAVRWSWKVNPTRAEKADWVVAVVDGVCRGVYEVHRWEPSTQTPGRWFFVGRQLDADSDPARSWVGKLIPEEFRQGRNPIRYGWR